MFDTIRSLLALGNVACNGELPDHVAVFAGQWRRNATDPAARAFQARQFEVEVHGFAGNHATVHELNIVVIRRHDHDGNFFVAHLVQCLRLKHFQTRGIDFLDAPIAAQYRDAVRLAFDDGAQARLAVPQPGLAVLEIAGARLDGGCHVIERACQHAHFATRRNLRAVIQRAFTKGLGVGRQLTQRFGNSAAEKYRHHQQAQ